MFFRVTRIDLITIEFRPFFPVELLIEGFDILRGQEIDEGVAYIASILEI